jgi:hypothetical protein
MDPNEAPQGPGASDMEQVCDGFSLPLSQNHLSHSLLLLLLSFSSPLPAAPLGMHAGLALGGRHPPSVPLLHTSFVRNLRDPETRLTIPHPSPPLPSCTLSFRSELADY